MEEINPIKLKEILFESINLTDLNQQEINLQNLTKSLESNPNSILSIYNTITSLISEENTNLIIARWTASIMESFLCRNLLSVDKKSILASQSLTAIARMLAYNDIGLQKIGIQCFSSSFPLLFKEACSGGDYQTWSHAVALKDTVLRIWRNGSIGARLAALKGVQRVIQTQTKGTADPRLQRTAEPNLSLCGAGHPFLNPRKLELEATELLEECIKALFTSSIPDVVSASTNALSNLVKIRPVFSNLVLTALSNWTPGALVGQANTQVKSVEKTIKICLTHLLKTAHANAFATQINEFLSRQAHRMEHAANEAKRQKEQEATKKRQSISDEIFNSTKRRKAESVVVDTAAVFKGVGAGKVDAALAQFDVTTLPINLVVDLVISSFQVLPPDILRRAINDAWIHLPPRDPSEILVAAEAVVVKIEVVDPLKLDFGEEELELKGELLAPEVENAVEAHAAAEADLALAEAALDLNDASVDLILPSSLSTSTKTSLIESAMRRLCDAGIEGVAPSLWAPLVSRLITRGLPSGEEGEEDLMRKENLRSIVFDFVIGDTHSRLEIARLWLNEEWYVEHRAVAEEASETRAYDRWLRKLLGYLSEFSSNRDRSFSQFIVDLPEIPSDEIGRLGEMCVNPDQVQLGFTALRDLALLRPPVRQEALDVLLGLTTHSDKLTRNASIMTVKRWAPDVQPLGDLVVAFALSLFARLEVPVPKVEEVELKVEEEKEVKDEDDMDMDNEEEKVEEVLAVVLPYAEVKNGLVIDRLQPPSTVPQVVQHVELLLALTVKNSDLLINIFEFYPRLQPFAQDSLLTLITPLIRTLGATHPKIAEAIENCPVGADALLLRALTILLDKSRLPAPLIASVQILAKKRKLHPRFYVMIISECSKEDIITYLPRLATLLNNTPEEKAIVRSAFLSILASASQNIASHSARNSELLPAVELMTLLHRSEKEIGLKCAIEAIAICFSMPDAFRPEVLAAFMQQVVDQPELPVLFLRTAIQAVTTYKTLSTFVSTILLNRLIAREVWNTKPLWDGFLRLAKITAPQSFPAILQLPQANLIDLVKQQPTLKDDLRLFATQNYPRDHERTDDFLEALGEVFVQEVKEEPCVVNKFELTAASYD